MPRIDAVRIGKKLISESDVSFVKAYQCPKTKTIFGNKDAYVTYLRNRRADLHAKISRDEKIAELHNCMNFDDVVQWVHDNSAFYLSLARMRESFSSNLDRYPNADEFKVTITYLNLRYGMVSNSHHCPKDGVTNWGGDPKLPREYPGWEGHIEFNYSHDLPGFNWRSMEMLRIFTGTGGGRGGNRYGFDVRFFDADWVGLSRANTFAIIKNPKMGSLYRYGEPYYFRS